MRKRRAFGPRRSSRFVKLKHYVRHRGHQLFKLEFGQIDSFRFITSSALPDLIGRSDWADAMRYMPRGMLRDGEIGTIDVEVKVLSPREPDE